MSTNVSFSGVSIKILEDKKDEESLIDVAKILEYDEKLIKTDFEDLMSEPKTKQWQLFKDVDGETGLVYLIDNESDVFDIDFGQSLEQLNEILGELHPDVREHFMDKDAANVKAFALIYYNGSENPFKF